MARFTDKFWLTVYCPSDSLTLSGASDFTENRIGGTPVYNYTKSFSIGESGVISARTIIDAAVTEKYKNTITDCAAVNVEAYESDSENKLPPDLSTNQL